jgi:hypothetical protein
MQRKGRKRGKLFLIIILGAIIIAVGALGYCLISKNIEHKHILEIIKPEINNYCQDLKNNPIGIGNCPTCFYQYPSNKDNGYVYENNLSKILFGLTIGNRYNIEKGGGIYKVTVQLYLIFGMRNDYVGDALLYFNIDKDGKIISENLTKEECH